MTSVQPIISLSDASKSYATTMALRRINLDVAPGEFVLLTGPSGAGKSTLVSCLSLSDTFDEGTVRIDGVDLRRLRAAAIPYLRRRFGVVYQDLRLLADQTVLANVRCPLDIRGLPLAAARQRAEAALEQFGLSAQAAVLVKHLSGGERQRVAVARALVAEPPILLADEPTGNLDARWSEQVISLLQERSRQGTTVLLATHDPLVLLFSDATRVVELDHGEIVSEQEQRHSATAFSNVCPREMAVDLPRAEVAG